MKKILFLLLIAAISLYSCRREGMKQNLDISVSGKVMNESGTGVSNVTIYIKRGKIGNYAATVYSNYEMIKSDINGNYEYTVKNDTYVYKICCELPSGYVSVTPGCKEVDHSVIDSHTIPNIINFVLKK
ncbi:MAG TPA: hypothetical protein PKX92_09285 [Edaphocola sp.]|nr:hypothetical protein [Edaphocola sp.]